MRNLFNRVVERRLGPGLRVRVVDWIVPEEAIRTASLMNLFHINGIKILIFPFWWCALPRSACTRIRRIYFILIGIAPVVAILMVVI